MHDQNKKYGILSQRGMEIPDPYMRLHISGDIDYLNKAARSLMLEDSRFRENLNIRSLLGKEESKDFLSKIRLVKEFGPIGNLTFTLPHFDDLFSYNADRIFDSHGNIVGIHGIIHRPEPIVEKNKDFYGVLETILNDFPLGLAIIRENGEMEINRTLMDMTGSSEIFICNELVPSWMVHIKLAEANNKTHVDVVFENPEKTPIELRLGRMVFQHKGTLNLLVAEPVENNGIGSHYLLKKAFPSENGIIDFMPIGLLYEDKKGQTVLANKRLKKNLHLMVDGLQEIRGRHIDSIFKLADPDYVNVKKLTNLSNQIKAASTDWTKDIFTCKDGTSLEVITAVMTDEDGSYMGRVWRFRDVSDLPGHDNIKPTTRNRYRSVIENMDLGLVEIDSSAKVVLVNNAFLNMSGLVGQRILGEDFYALVAMNCSIGQHCIGSRGCSLFEMDHTGSNGKVVHWIVSESPRMGNDGEEDGTIYIFFDNTANVNLIKEKKELVKKLEVQNQGLLDYAHVVSHDLKAPLRSIHTLSSWLREDYGSKLGEEGEKTVELIQKKVFRIEKLVKDILNYSTMSLDTDEFEPVDIGLIIRDVISMVDVPEGVKLSLPPTLPTVIGCKKRLFQVFQNLMLNSLQHMEKEGRIQIGCRTDGDFWEFSIKDNGPNIPKEYHNKLFTVYQTYDKTSQSMGLGLSIVKKIVERHGGKIWIETDEEGGSIIFFKIRKPKMTETGGSKI